MSKTSYLLIFILCVLVGAYFYFTYLTPIRTKLPTIKQEATDAKEVVQGTLSLEPQSQTLLPGQTANVDLFIKANGASPTLIQFEIGYDPSMITPTFIAPGKYFEQPIELLNSINPRNGRISYAIQCTYDQKNPKSSCNTNASESIAKITYTVNGLAGLRETSLNIMPKTLLETKDNVQVILKTTNAKINLRGAIQPIASPSAAVVLPQ